MTAYTTGDVYIPIDVVSISEQGLGLNLFWACFCVRVNVNVGCQHY